MYNSRIILCACRLIHPRCFSTSFIFNSTERNVSLATKATNPKIGVSRPEKSKLSLVTWFRNTIMKDKIKANAYENYSSMTSQINYIHTIKSCKMDDTFNSWFLITELHIWMLLVRLRPEGKDGKLASKFVMHALWDDTVARAKVLSPVDNATSRKQIPILSDELRGSLFIYDDGLLSTDTVLASALWYRLLSKSCEDPRLLESLVLYVRQQVHNLDNTTSEDILLRGQIKWLPFVFNPDGLHPGT